VASLRHADAAKKPPTTPPVGRTALAAEPSKPTFSIKGIIHTVGMMLSSSVN
jgi:hypothetical protein